jgi:hypothetical protein
MRFSSVGALIMFLVLVFSLDPACRLCSSAASSKMTGDSEGVERDSSGEASPWRWPKNSTVSVFFQEGSFSDVEVEELLRGIDIWNVASEQADVGIKFVCAGETLALVTTGLAITVSRGDTWTGKHLIGQFTPILFSEHRELQIAKIEIDNAVRNLAALESLMVHELGHGMGLEDCNSCRRTTSVMAKFDGRNKSNGLDRPTLSDIIAVTNAFGNDTRGLARGLVLPLSSPGQTVQTKLGSP